MTDSATRGLAVSIGSSKTRLFELTAVNSALRPLGLRVWRRDLRRIAPRLGRLLGQERPTVAELEEIKAAFLLDRRELLARVREARGSEAVPGGGALSTRVVNHGYDYPQLYLAAAGQDYSRFDRYHRNSAEDGTPVDEVLQLLSGGGFRVFQRGDGGEEVLLALSCPDPAWGWVLTYGGGRPHIGSLTQASPGTKLLVQVFGPPLWTMRYEED